MHAPRCLAVPFALAATLASAAEEHAARGAPPAAPAFDIRVRDTATFAVVNAVLKGAAVHLASPGCRRIFTSFHDADGRTLQSHLDELGVDPATYLGLVVFHDGRYQEECRPRTTLAYTYVGSRVVWICPEQFRDAAWRWRSTIEATVIHEVLHTLGLGENPPSTLDITSRVIAACHP